MNLEIYHLFYFRSFYELIFVRSSRVDERSENSNISRDDFLFFFKGKVLNFVQAQYDFFRFDFSFLFKFVKRKANSTYE